MEKITIAILLIGVQLSLIMGCAGSQIVGGPIPANSLNDGIYDGTAKNGPVKVVARITIQDQGITRIELLEHRTWKGIPAEKLIPERIINEQSTSVDAVSGATISSKTIMNAVEDAVRKAK